MRQPAARSIALVTLVVAALSGCAGDGPSAGPASSSSPRSPTAGGPALHLTCLGEGSPIVVMESGLNSPGDVFSLVAERVSQETRVCTYDRAGIGASPALDAASPDPSAGSAAESLQRTLSTQGTGQGISPPYVLVGWSYGGLVAQAFAATYPDQVGGVLLEDSAVPDELTAPFFADIDWTEGGRAIDKTATIHQLASADFGDTPLVVMTQGAATGRFREIWYGYHHELARLSTDTIHVQAVGSGHEIHAEAEGLEVALIGELVESVRAGTGLAACDNRFRPLRGRCV